MAKRKTSTSRPSQSVSINRLVRFAEQAGRMAGTLHSKADVVLDRPAVKRQVARIRDAASQLLKQLTRAKSAEHKDARPDPRGRSGGKVDAPGKKHRKAPARGSTLPRSAKAPKRNVAREVGRGRLG